MNKLQIIGLMASICFCASAFSASPGWPEEPSTIFGIQLNRALPYQQCAQSQRQDELCWSELVPTYHPSFQFAQLKKQPYLGFTYQLQALVSSNRVNQVRLQADVGYQASVYNLIVKRYGYPHDVKELQTAYNGAWVGYRAHFWNGKRVRIQFYESLSRESLPVTEVRFNGANTPWDIPVPKEKTANKAKPAKEIPRIPMQVPSF